MIYFNNAATTWPKPQTVYEHLNQSFQALDSPGRCASEDPQRADNLLEDARAEVAQFLGIKNESCLVFTPSCTYSLNIAIQGLPWKSGESLLISGYEHHAVSRPARKVAKAHSLELHIAPCSDTSPIDLDFVEDCLRTGDVRLVACMMASNVTGEIFPIKDLIDLVHRYSALCLVDAAQTVGILRVDVDELKPDMLAFAGHKGLFGPPGVGGLYIAPGVELETFAEGGTGGDSGQHEMPVSVPHRFEVGTHNLPAIRGLAAGTRWVQETGLSTIREHEMQLTRRFLDGLQKISDLTLYGTRELDLRTSVISLNLKGVAPKTLASWLAETHGVNSRAGFHCAPLAHESIGSLPGQGTIRFSMGYFNTPEEVDAVLAQLASAQEQLMQ